MSNLRIIGLTIGIIGLIVTFLIYRGPRWKRTTFILFSLCSLWLVVISIYPDALNFIREALSLQGSPRGGLIGLLIITNIFLLFFSLYTKSKQENLRLQFDKLVRNLGTNDFEEGVEIGGRIKPITILIPAYNEAENLRMVLPRIPEQIGGVDVGVLVCDDGSEDDTADVVRQHGHLVVSNRINRGQGATSRLGYDILLKYNALVGVTIDGDNQHRPEDLERLISPILDGKYDLVIGSRILGVQEKSDRIRNVGIIIFSKILSLIIGLRITDCSSGFKAFKIENLRRLNLTEDQFQSAEVLIEGRKKGLNIGEVPITINRRKYGHSKKGTDLRYGLHFARAIIKAWWR